MYSCFLSSEAKEDLKRIYYYQGLVNLALIRQITILICSMIALTELKKILFYFHQQNIRKSYVNELKLVFFELI